MTSRSVLDLHSHRLARALGKVLLVLAILMAYLLLLAG